MMNIILRRLSMMLLASRPRKEELPVASASIKFSTIGIARARYHRNGTFFFILLVVKIMVI